MLEEIKAKSGLKYVDKVNYYEGIVVEVHDGALGIDVMGRLGFMKLPSRMFIADGPFEVGQTVGWTMSFIEQKGPEINEKYLSNIETRNRRAEEISRKYNNEED